MNIKRCKEEITNTIKAYLRKDEFGAYKIPVKHQRPILLIGPPGIGKTAIMEQIARECEIALVAYTITHHTRQSAIGLPKIEKKRYQDVEYDVTEYTMSEIIASVYDKIQATGLKEGILFLDEVNCVSETLAPTMLQFLQNKTFGNHSIPEGWVIVAAGNPPEYNKSVREFDIVTLDRVKRLELNEDYTAWKEYAYKNHIHSAIISYLDIRKDHFYQIETTVDGKKFVTARGWEDLSLMIYAYEELGLKVTEDVVIGYVQHNKIAKDFTNYLELFYKYKDDYRVDEILQGVIEPSVVEKLETAPFDEKLSVIGLLLGKLNGMFVLTARTESYMDLLFEQLKAIKGQLDEGSKRPTDILEAAIITLTEAMESKKQAGLIDKEDEMTGRRVCDSLRGFTSKLQSEKCQNHEEAYQLLRTLFAAEKDLREEENAKTTAALASAFDFMEASFGPSQEMVVFVTELTANYYSMRFIRENGSDKYYQHNQGLLFHETRKELLDEIKEVQSL